MLALGAITFLFTKSTWHLTSVIGKLLPSSGQTDVTTTIVSLLLISISLATGYFIFRHKELTLQSASLSPQFYLDWFNKIIVKSILLLSGLVEAMDRKWIDSFIHGVAYFNVTVAHLAGWSDRKLVDGFVNGTAFSTRGLGAITRSLANGKIQSYLLWAMAGLVIFILWILY
jgi:NADH-quinone oxidoreductase subunit L